MVWYVGSAFAGLGGALVAWDNSARSLSRIRLRHSVFCVVLIGGVGSIYGAILAALLVALVQSFVVAFDLAALIPGAPNLRFPSPTDRRDLRRVVLLLLFRPSGLARKEV